jgi:hypothetical protein
MVTASLPTQPASAPAEPSLQDVHTALFLDHITDTARTNDDIRRTVRLAVRTLRRMLSGRIPFSEDVLQVAKLAIRIRPLPMPRPFTPRAPRISTPPSPPRVSPGPAAAPGLTRPPAPSQPAEAAAAAPSPSPAPAPTPSPARAAESSPASKPAPSLKRDEVLSRLAEVEALDVQLDELDIESASLRRRADDATTEADRHVHLKNLLDLETLRRRPLLDQAAAILSAIPIADLQAASYAVPTPL